MTALALRLDNDHQLTPPPTFPPAKFPVGRHDALVLNADYRPLTYFPLTTWSWQDAVKAVMAGSVAVVAEYDLVARSPTQAIRLPSVVALKDFVPVERRVPCTRRNVFIRDGWQCQYCGGHFHTAELTFDHVVPRAQGGLTTWDNIVAACGPCNLRKADRTPAQAGMPLLKRPVRPSIGQLLQAERRVSNLAQMHQTWLDFLYWEAELEA